MLGRLNELQGIGVRIPTEQGPPARPTQGKSHPGGLEPTHQPIQIRHRQRQVPVAPAVGWAPSHRVRVGQLQQMDLPAPDLEPGTRVTQVRAIQNHRQPEQIPVEGQRAPGIGDE